MANTTQDIIDRIKAGLFALFGNDINLNPDEPIGQIHGSLGQTANQAQQ